MANKWLYIDSNVGSNVNSYGGGTSTNYNGIEIQASNTFPIETQVNVKTNTDYTIDDGYIKVPSNNVDNASTIRFRDDATDVGPNISVAANTTGTFEDSTSASIASGSLVNWNLTIGAGAHGDAITVSILSGILSDTAGGKPVYQANHVGTLGIVAQATTEYFAVKGNFSLNELLETNVKYKIRYASTFSNLLIDISDNTVSATSTATLRDDAADTSLVASITADTTGTFEDNSNTASVASGSDIDYEITGGIDAMGGNLNTRFLNMTSTATSSNVVASSLSSARNFGTTVYIPLGGTNIGSTTETNAQSKPRYTVNLKNLFFLISANTIDDNTDVTLRVNGADSSLAAQVATLTTGVFEDTTDTISVAATDEVNYSFVIGGTLGSITSYNIGVEQLEPVTATSIMNMCLMGVG